jgi:hypothetical protein
MEFVCNLLNIKLTGIFKVKFCETYEKLYTLFRIFEK